MMLLAVCKTQENLNLLAEIHAPGGYIVIPPAFFTHKQMVSVYIHRWSWWSIFFYDFESLIDRWDDREFFSVSRLIDTVIGLRLRWWSVTISIGVLKKTWICFFKKWFISLKKYYIVTNPHFLMIRCYIIFVRENKPFSFIGT